MSLTNRADEIKSLLEEDGSLSDCRILTAYPNAKKPSLLQHTYVVVYPDEAQGEACSLGECRQLMRCRVAVGVYVPQHDGIEVLCRLAQEITDTLTVTMPQEVSISKIEVHDELNGYAIICSFVYLDAIGGN